jgi:hypothetical protein
MATLFETIQQLVAEEKYIICEPAADGLEQRGIMDGLAGSCWALDL